MLLNGSNISYIMLTTAAIHSHLIAPEVYSKLNTSLLINIVKSLHKKYDFRNFVFFISDDLHSHLDLFPIFCRTFPDVPKIITSQEQYKISGFISYPSLCFVVTTGVSDPIMALAAHNLKRSRYIRTMFVLVPKLARDDNLFKNVKNIYTWIWQQQFTRTFLYTINNNIYIQDPYPTPTITNKTDNWSVKDFFINYSRDMKGYVIRTPICYDLPRVFPMPNTSIPSGTSGKLFYAFLRSRNATLEKTDACQTLHQSYNLTKILHDIQEGFLDISIHSYTQMLRTGAGSSYPIGINDFCIMMPYHSDSPDHLYMPKALRPTTWLVVGMAVLTAALIIWLWTPAIDRDFGLSFLQSITSMLWLPPTTLHHSAVSLQSLRIIHLVIYVLGFFISNMYVSKMASYFSTSLAQQQINTVNDVLATNLRILVIHYEYYQLELRGFPKKFLQRLILVNKNIMDAHRDNLNTTYGYSTQSDRWSFGDIQQKYLKKPIFRLSEICVGPFYHVFPIQVDSHLYTPLQYFILDANQYGLQELWRKEAFADALALKYMRMLSTYEETEPLTLSFFYSIWLVWGIGLILSVAVFIYEIKCKKLRNIRTRFIH